jgi:hypothetical protein
MTDIIPQTRRERATALVSKGIQTVEDRQGTYGEPSKDMAKIALIWTGVLRDKLLPGVTISATDVPLLMIGVKLSRASNEYKDDNMVDVVGYAQVYEECVYSAEVAAP